MISALPPGPRDPFAMLRYARSTFAFQRAAAARYGDAFTVRLGGRPFVLLATPDGARELFSLPPDALGACMFPFGNDAVRPALGEHSVLLTSGPRHAEDRRSLARASGAASDLEEAASVASAGVLADRAGQTVSLDLLCRQISSRAVALAVLGPGAPLRELEVAMLEMAPAVPMRLLLAPGFYQGFPWSPTSRRFYRAQARLAALVREVVTSRPGGLVAGWAEPDETGRPAFDLEQRVQQAVTYLGAGAEGLASMVARAVVCTADHPDVMGPIADEARDPGAGSRRLLPALCESLRRYPVITETFRELRSPQRVAGYDLPAGTAVGVAIAAIHTHPASWEDAMDFRPSRFEGARPSSHAYLPFGGSPRRCLGASMAMVMGAVATAALLRHGEVGGTRAPVPLVRGRLSMTIPMSVGYRVKAAA